MNNPKVIIKETKLGVGVFADKNFEIGEEIFEFIGPIIESNADIIPNSYVDKHCIQVSEHCYIGPAGGPDDFLNHSCEPNAGIKIRSNKLVLIAVKYINKGEEITFDYSTSMAEDRFEMDCGCESQSCRGRIKDFKHLPKETQDKYMKLEIVPQFVLDSRIKKGYDENKIKQKADQGCVKLSTTE